MYVKRLESRRTEFGLFVSQVSVAWAEPSTGNVGDLLAFANVTLNHEFVIRDLKVVECSRGIRLCMPNKPKYEGGYLDIAFCVNQATRDVITDAVMSAYFEALARPDCRRPKRTIQGYAPCLVRRSA